MLIIKFKKQVITYIIWIIYINPSNVFLNLFQTNNFNQIKEKIYILIFNLYVRMKNRKK